MLPSSLLLLGESPASIAFRQEFRRCHRRRQPRLGSGIGYLEERLLRQARYSAVAPSRDRLMRDLELIILVLASATRDLCGKDYTIHKRRRSKPEM